MEMFRYLNGRKFRRLESGEWVYCGKPYRKYGSTLVKICVPKEMVPWLRSILAKLEEIETARRNISGCIYNVSPEVYIEKLGSVRPFPEGDEDDE
ncbi:MAG: hypothetical protein Q4D62_05285 [Planctomycetia bacterium]|nr:hypothetical protein [Planctomycetia bacterium]